MNNSNFPSYQQLLEENARLRQENAQLRYWLGISQNQYVNCSTGCTQISNSNQPPSQDYSSPTPGNYNQVNFPQIRAQEQAHNYHVQPLTPSPSVGQNVCTFSDAPGSTNGMSNWDTNTCNTTSDGNPNYSSVYNSQKTLEQEKERRLSIFEGLFKGREDVFARRWCTSNGKKGYSPVCVFERECFDRGFKCKECPNKKFFPLNREYLEAHLNRNALERDVIGMYPIRKDNTVFFLCADFDDKSCEFGYQDDVLTYAQVARDWGIDCAIERSRSGSGAHAWIFFEENVPASEARQLGKAILDAAMNRRGKISFKSYDRFFPNQDKVPHDGFGNLVALPLQGLAKQDGNSLFVDDNFIPYQDQWTFLESIKKLDTPTLKKILSEQSKGEFERISITTSKSLDKDSETKPWETIRIDKINKSDFNGSVNIVRANGLYFRQSELSSKVITQLKKLASFYNPAYFKALNGRMPVYNNPMIISSSYFVGEFLVLPRGCEDLVKKLFDEKGIEYNIEDNTNNGHQINAEFKGELYPQQKEVLEVMIKYNNGILNAPTATGKTVIAMGLIASRKVNTLILMSNDELIGQWRTSLSNFIELNSLGETIQESISGQGLNIIVNPKVDFNDTVSSSVSAKKRGRKKREKDKFISPFGTLNSRGNSLLGNVDIASVKSCVDLKTGEVKDFVRNYGMIIVDECHHAASRIYQQVLGYANAKYVYGLTATTERYDGHERLVEMQCGPVRLKLSSEEQRRNQTFSRVLVPRFTSFRWLKEGKVQFMELVQEITNDKLRNQQIIDDVLEAIEAGRKPIIITRLLEHVELLCQNIKEKMPEVLVLKMIGTNKAKEKKEKERFLANLKADQKFVLVATDTYIGEGFDLPILDTLFFTTPFSFKGKLKQNVGRIHRNFEGKNEVRVYDYVDINVDYTNSQYRNRLKTYSKEGYVISKKNVEIQESIDMIFGEENYFETYMQDIQNAKTSIMITVPKIFISQTPLIDILQQKMYEGVIVRVFTQIEKEFNTHLTQKGVNVMVTPKASIPNVVIDKDIVWYGDLNYLSRDTRKDEDVCALRLIDTSLANSLINHLSI